MASCAAAGISFFFSLPPANVVLYLHLFFPFPPPSVSLLLAGTEEDVVYPGKLPHCLCREFPLGDGTAGTGPAQCGEKLTVKIPARLWRGLGRLRWDLMPGVSRPSPGTVGDEGDREQKRKQ